MVDSITGSLGSDQSMKGSAQDRINGVSSTILSRPSNPGTGHHTVRPILTVQVPVFTMLLVVLVHRPRY